MSKRAYQKGLKAMFDGFLAPGVKIVAHSMVDGSFELVKDEAAILFTTDEPTQGVVVQRAPKS